MYFMRMIFEKKVKNEYFFNRFFIILQVTY